MQRNLYCVLSLNGDCANFLGLGVYQPRCIEWKNEIKTESLTSEKECITCHDVENDDDFDYVRDLKVIRCPKE